jgi:hypothetical protein
MTSFCADLLTDPNNCHACNNACAAGEVCDQGACSIVCPAGQTTCAAVGGGQPYCSTLLTVQDCLRCGSACALNQDCSGSGCVACTPVVGTPPMVPNPPAGLPLQITCGGGPGGSGAQCPDVVCGSITYYFYTYTDNSAIGIVGFDPSGNVARGPIQVTNVRYIDTVTLDPSTQTALLKGQPPGSATIPWSDFR